MTAPVRTLVLGGTRSGKSAYAENLVSGYRDVRYVATGRHDATDSDWQGRIETHRERRPSHWTTVEAVDELGAVLTSQSSAVTLVDDLGTWLTGTIDGRDAWELPRGSIAADTDALVDAIMRSPNDVVLVSPEVGWSVVPSTRSGRLFQDEMGILNTRVAAVCDTVVLVVAGLPLALKTAPPR